jgi:tetratricopeptide (TPR) repeat protein
MERHDEAVTEYRRAVTLEPQATIYGAVLTRGLLEGGKTELALENAKKVYAFDPDYPSSLNWLVLAHAANGNYTDALALISKERGRTGRRDYNLFAGWAYAKMGKLAEAKQELAWLKEQRGTASEYSVGLLEAAIGNRDEAFAAFERAFAAKEMRLAYMKADPFAAPLRGDPRFASFVKRMGLAP